MFNMDHSDMFSSMSKSSKSKSKSKSATADEDMDFDYESGKYDSLDATKLFSDYPVGYEQEYDQEYATAYSEIEKPLTKKQLQEIEVKKQEEERRKQEDIEKMKGKLTWLKSKELLQSRVDKPMSFEEMCDEDVKVAKKCDEDLKATKEFPTLNMALNKFETPKERVQYTPKKQTPSQTRHFVIGAKSYAETQYEQRRAFRGNRADYFHKKSEAMQLTGAKPDQFAHVEQPESRHKTVMCRHVMAGRKCFNGDQCVFAHTFDELNIHQCKFGDRCNRFDNPENQCIFQHPCETREDYLVRMKMIARPSQPQQKPKPQPDQWQTVTTKKTQKPTFTKPSVSSFALLAETTPEVDDKSEQSESDCETDFLDVPEHCSVTSKKSVTSDSSEKSVTSEKSVSSSRTEQPTITQPAIEKVTHKDAITQTDSIEKEMVLRVPANMVSVAMEAAIRAGHTNIRLEIC